MDPTLVFYLQGARFPATKAEVAATVERNGIPEMATKLRNATAWRFDSAEEVAEVLRKGRSYSYNRENYRGTQSERRP